VPSCSLWDESPLPAWSQLRRRLRDDPDVWSLLRDAIYQHPATSGRLVGLRARRPERPSDSTWFTGTWVPGNTGVLVKVNITQREQFWMSAASQATTDIVPRVLASDSSLGELGVAWLVLEWLPYGYDPEWRPAAFSSLLEAAARFQVFAASVDTRLIYEEGIGTIRNWALRGRDLCPEAGVVVRNLERDWAWVTAVAGPEVMFGDLHFGNAAFRNPPPHPRALLFDPIPRRQPWPFEPAYFEVLCGGSGLVRQMAAIRAAQNRPTCGPGQIDRLAILYCGWMALLWWGILPQNRPDAAWRTRLTSYVTAAARLDR
jgi:hypothetical protein